MAILIKGTDFTDGDQVTAATLDALVDAATFASGAVDSSTTQLSGGAIIVKDLGVTAAKLENATNGQLMIGTGAGFTKATLTAGTGITVTNASGAITVGLSSSGTLPVADGGTGQTTYTNGELLIGNTTGNTLTKATLTAGTNIAVTNGSGAITLGLTGAVAAVNGGTGLSASGASGNILTSNGTTWVSSTPSGSSAGGNIFLANNFGGF